MGMCAARAEKSGCVIGRPCEEFEVIPRGKIPLGGNVDVGLTPRRRPLGFNLRPCAGRPVGGDELVVLLAAADRRSIARGATRIEFDHYRSGQAPGEGELPLGPLAA